MIDVHCHLNFHSFKDDVKDVVKEAREAGVSIIVNVGTSIESSIQAVELANKFEDMYAIVGVHPHHADKLSNDWANKLEKIACNEKVIGIGEIGLDYYSYKSNGIVNPEVQKEVFVSQIELAHKLKLPLQIHNRQAGEDVVSILKKFGHLLEDVPGMFHCFAGSFEVLEDALDLGFYIGFDGNITYKGIAAGETVSLSELAKKTPIDRILIETDAPFLTPIPLRGKRNTPKNVIITANFISALKSVNFSVLEEAVENNFNKVFLTNNE